MNNKKKTGAFSVFLHVCGYLMVILFFITVGTILIPKILGYESFYVVSGSMAPTIPVDSMIYVKETEPEGLEAGDIIAYNSNGVTVTHRITENDTLNREFHTKGDGNEIEDMRTVRYDDLIGEVAFHVPYMGILGVYLNTVLGRILFVLFGVTGLVLTWV